LLALAIGGLIMATVATLVFVPVVFSVLHRKKAAAPVAEGKKGSVSPDISRAIPAT